jgi:proline iminopeptidase
MTQGLLRTLDGVALRYEVIGAGPPLIVCAGGPFVTFRYLRDDVAPLGREHTVVLWHYRGSGESGAAPPATYTFERLADDLDELRAHLGYDRIDVLAHCLGGMVAMQYALRHPQRCERLVLVAAAPTVRPDRVLLPALPVFGFKQGTRVLAHVLAYWARWGWRPRTVGALRASGALLDVLLQIDQSNLKLVRRIVGSLRDNDNSRQLLRQWYRADLTRRLPSIGCPALVVYGTRDAFFVVGARRFRAGLPRAEFVELPGVAHHPLLEAPAKSLDAIRSFLADRAPVGRVDEVVD